MTLSTALDRFNYIPKAIDAGTQVHSYICTYVYMHAFSAAAMEFLHNLNEISYFDSF
jgi:hypothetical protein